MFLCFLFSTFFIIWFFFFEEFKFDKPIGFLEIIFWNFFSDYSRDYNTQA